MRDPDKTRIRESYDEWAGAYDRIEALGEWLGIRRLRRHVFGRASGRVLEVAVGTGKNLAHYRPDRVDELVGVDLSPGMLSVAGPRAAAAPFPVELLEGDAEDLPFEARSFDTVTSSLSSCTFPDPVRALGEMERVCRPDGRILLLEHGRSSSSWLGRFQDWRAEAHAERFGCRWNREPHELARAAGLRVERHRRAFFGVFHAIEAKPG